jgi:prepilin-type processing-associated H-X9-DG protein/prepilin-type N-terminal cleavage/methylation domain-containing protein
MRRRLGLSLLELLVVVVIIAIVIAVLLPTRAHGGPARRTVCMTRLRQQGQAFWSYTANYNGDWPASKAVVGSLCEQTIETRNALMTGTSGTTAATFQRSYYCPVNMAQDPGKLWSVGGVSIWGYVWMNDRAAAGASLPKTFPARTPSLQYLSLPNTKTHLVTAILALDVIVTDTDAPPFNYSPKGVAVDFGTNHVVSASAPSSNYVNVLFADGHGESVKFDPKKAVAVKPPGGGFFWFPNP